MRRIKWGEAPLGAKFQMIRNWIIGSLFVIIGLPFFCIGALIGSIIGLIVMGYNVSRKYWLKLENEL